MLCQILCEYGYTPSALRRLYSLSETHDFCSRDSHSWPEDNLPGVFKGQHYGFYPKSDMYTDYI